uniref:Uncharacterized protein n=1 Tax=Rhizophora mucronata TaxID=61149 RepID=A0A2P2N1N0_RHIMU
MKQVPSYIYKKITQKQTCQYHLNIVTSKSTGNYEQNKNILG